MRRLSLLLFLLNLVLISSEANDSIERINTNETLISSEIGEKNETASDSTSLESKEKDEAVLVLNLSKEGSLNSSSEVNMPSNSSESKSDESKEVKERENEDQTTMLPIVLPSLDSVSNETVQNASAEGNHDDFPVPVVIDLSHETKINHNFNPTPPLVIEPPINRSIIESAKEPTISDQDQDNTQTGIHKNKTIVEPQRVLMPPLNPTAPENVIKPTQKEPESHIEKVHVAPLVGSNETSEFNVTHAAQRANTAHSCLFSSIYFLFIFVFCSFI